MSHSSSHLAIVLRPTRLSSYLFQRHDTLVACYQLEDLPVLCCIAEQVTDKWVISIRGNRTRHGPEVIPMTYSELRKGNRLHSCNVQQILCSEKESEWGFEKTVRFSMAVDSPEDAVSLFVLERDYKLIKETGYQAVEPLVNNPKDIEWKQIRSIVDKHGLKVSGLRTGRAYTQSGLSLTDPKKEIRRKATQRIKEVIQVASSFNALVLIGLMQGKLKAGVDLKQGRDWVVESLIECAKVAEDYGVILAVESLNRYELSYNNTVAEILEMINKIGSKNVSLLVDTFHMNIEEFSICDSILKARDYIGHVHFADSNRQAPGEGHLDFPMIVESLRKIGYRGYITVENEWKRSLNRADLSKAITYLKKLTA